MKTSMLQGGSQTRSVKGEINAQIASQKVLAYVSKGVPGGAYARWREKKAHQIAVGEAIAAGRTGICPHFLTDYRDNNSVVARKTMDLKTAFHYNKRLEGTGFAWARKST